MNKIILDFRYKRSICSDFKTSIRKIFGMIYNIPLTKENVLKFVNGYFTLSQYPVHERYFFGEILMQLLSIYFKKINLYHKFEQNNEKWWLTSVDEQWKYFEKILKEIK